MEEWFFRKIINYWDINYDAINKYSSVIRKYDKLGEVTAVKSIQEAIKKHVEVLSDKDLIQAAFCMIDDLYKAANYVIIFDNAVSLYLEASAGTFCNILRKRGYLIHYIADNTFSETLIDFERPVKIFRDWFCSAGLKYICPQEAAFMIMEHDKVDKNDFFTELPRYIDEAQMISNNVVKLCHANNDHYLFINTDERNSEEVYKLSFDVAKSPGIITIYRNEPPIKHSKVSLILPKQKLP